MESWQSEYLSMGGRVVLIQLVLNSIPIYQILVNVFLEGVKKNLHGLFQLIFIG